MVTPLNSLIENYFSKIKEFRGVNTRYDKTAIDLESAGNRVTVVADAVDSRSPHSREIALARLARAGVEIVTTEMVVFEWMRRADIPEFRSVSALVK